MDTYGKKVWSETGVPLNLLKINKYLNSFCSEKTQIFRHMEKQLSNAQWCWEHFMTSRKQSESMIAGQEEPRELTSHAGQDEHRHRVWYWVVGLSGEKMVASIMAQWRKSYC